MKKSLMILSLVLASLSVVVAADMTFSIGGIESPVDGAYVGEKVLIEWENVFQDAMLKYNSGTCNVNEGFTLKGNIDSDGSYNWDLSYFDDGDYCIKIVVGDRTFYAINITKDTVAPVIEFIGTPYFGNTTLNVSIEASIVDNGTVREWTLDFGDGSDAVIGASASVDVSHNYTEEGSYVVTLIAVDNASNEAEKSVTVFISDEVSDFEIVVSAGEMNAFSIPLMPESSDIKDVLGKEIYSRAERIWSYQGGSWKYNVPTSSGWSTSSSRLGDIIPGYGYILFMDEDSVVRGKGSAPGVNTPTQGIEMVSGWNFVGVNGGNKTIARALSSVDLGDSYRWNEVRDSNWGFVSNYSSPVGIFAATRAYWVSVITEDGPIYL